MLFHECHWREDSVFQVIHRCLYGWRLLWGCQSHLLSPLESAVYSCVPPALEGLPLALLSLQ